MKILFNGYLNLLPSHKKPGYGGPQIFTKLFAKYIHSKTSHSYFGVVINPQKSGTTKLSTKIVKQGRHRWVVADAVLYTKNVIKAKRPVLPAGSKDTIDRLVAILEDLRPDVVFMNGFSVTNWYLLQAAHKVGIPIVSVHHGLWFKDIQALGGVFTKSGKLLAGEMEKDITRFSAKEIFLNKLSSQVYQKSLIKVPKQQLAIVPLPYNPQFLSKNITRLNERKSGRQVRIGLVGRWDPIKNHQAYLSLAQLAIQQGLPWKFFSVTHCSSDKQDDFYKEYSKYVTVLEQMTARSLKNFYQSMELLVLPSHFDVFPTVIMEALLQNKGTIISPNVGWVDIYKKNSAGNWIDAFNNPKLTLKRIEKLLISGPPRKLIRYTITRHNSENIFKEYLKIFQNIIKK